MKQKRIFFLDLIRVFSIIMVVMIHCFYAKCPDKLPHTAFDAAIYLPVFFFGLTGVGLFVMISGALILPKELREGYRFLWRRVLGFGLLIAFWSVVTNTVVYICQGRPPWEALLFSLRYHSVIIGGWGNYAGHLWFLLMIMSLYLAAPFLARMIEKMPVRDYFVFAGITALLFLIPGTFNYQGRLPGLTEADFAGIMGRFDLFGVYASWFILGYLFTTVDMEAYLRRWSRHYLAWLWGILLVSSLSGGYAVYKLTVMNNLQLFVPMIQFTKSLPMYINVLTMFLLFKHYAHKLEFLQKPVHMLAKYSFGLYLIHFPMITVVSVVLAGWSMDSSTHILVITPVCFLLTMFFSLALSMVLDRFRLTRYLIK